MNELVNWQMNEWMNKLIDEWMNYTWNNSWTTKENDKYQQQKPK